MRRSTDDSDWEATAVLTASAIARSTSGERRAASGDGRLQLGQPTSSSSYDLLHSLQYLAIEGSVENVRSRWQLLFVRATASWRSKTYPTELTCHSVRKSA